MKTKRKTSKRKRNLVFVFSPQSFAYGCCHWQPGGQSYCQKTPQLISRQSAIERDNKSQLLVYSCHCLAREVNFNFNLKSINFFFIPFFLPYLNQNQYESIKFAVFEKKDHVFRQNHQDQLFLQKKRIFLKVDLFSLSFKNKQFLDLNQFATLKTISYLN